MLAYIPAPWILWDIGDFPATTPDGPTCFRPRRNAVRIDATGTEAARGSPACAPHRGPPASGTIWHHPLKLMVMVILWLNSWLPQVTMVGYLIV